MEFIGIGVTGLLVTIGTLWGYIELKRSGTTRLIESLKQYDPLYLSDYWKKIYYCVDIVGENEQKWENAVLLITHKRIALYSFNPSDDRKNKAVFTIERHELRGFWQRIVYRNGETALWVHAEIGNKWYILKLKPDQYDTPTIIRALKEISTSEQVSANYITRPYTYIDKHKGLTIAIPAHQSLTGDWELDSLVQLYLTPLFLVIFRKNYVVEKINLSKIQNISALKRMEGGKPEGLIRFFVDNKLRAFAIDEYEEWAELIATASKRTLEEPVMRKRKGKDDFDDWDED